jgi:hypothetical protein
MSSKQIRAIASFFSALFIISTILLVSPVHVDAAGSIEVGVAFGHISDYIWSSDGTQVAFIKYAEGESWGDLWVGNWDGYGVTSLHVICSEIEVNALEDWQDDWILLRIRQENELPDEYYGRGELWKIRSDGTDLTQVTFTYTNGIRTVWSVPAYNNTGTARWGRFIPGTDLVYFQAHDGNGWWKSYTCFANGTDGWQLISGSAYAFTIGMSPIGNKLLWGTATYYNQPTTLMASNVNGSGVVTIKTFSAVTTPLVLEDGETIVYSLPNGSIGAIQMNGTNDRIVLDNEYPNSWINYHPTAGQSFLMKSNRSLDGNFHIFSIDVNGTNIIQLTDGAHDDDSAMFSPNGQNLLYRRLPTFSETSYELIITGAKTRPSSAGTTTIPTSSTTSPSSGGLPIPFNIIEASIIVGLVLLIIIIFWQKRKGT